MPERFLRGVLLRLAACVALGASTAGGRCCVWRVHDGAGHTLYLAGSIHALRPSDYPFPRPYEEAYTASSAVAFETDLTVKPERWEKAMGSAAIYPKDGKLKDHVDPRTYAYILHVISNTHGSTTPEKRIEHLRPWALASLLSTPGGIQGVGTQYGVELDFLQQAKHDGKPVAGLVPFDEHIAVFGKMNDADSEAVLLLAFIHLNTEGKAFDGMVANWKRGDIEAFDKMDHDEYQDAPALGQRILTDRNRRWLPTLEEYLRSGKTWMVIAGTGHMAGDEGVPALLRAKGYQVEQL